MKIAGIILTALISMQAQAAHIQKFVGKDHDVYRVTMDDKFDRIAMSDIHFNFALESIEDFRCPPKLTCLWDGGIVLHGHINDTPFKLEYREDESIDSIMSSDYGLKLIHMIGGFYDEPYVFDLEVINKDIIN